MVAGLFKGNILVLFDSTDCSEAGSVYVIGVDEAGRGPLAGPVVAGAFCLVSAEVPEELRFGVADSKQISEENRESIFHSCFENNLEIKFKYSIIENRRID